MAMMAPESGKNFEKPKQGKHIGTVIDVVDLGIVTPKNPNPAFPSAPTHRVQILWVLNTFDSEGKPLLYSEAPPFKVGEGGGKYKPTRLYEIATGVYQGAIPRPFDVESLLGKSNELFIIKNGGRTEIAGFLPVPPNVVPPQVPVGFVRKINKPAATPPVQTGQPANPYVNAAAPQQPASQPPAQQKEVAF